MEFEKRLLLGFLFIVILFSTGFYTASVYAETPWIEIHGLSKHSEDSYRIDGVTHKFNERNYGVGVMFTASNYIEYGGGVFKNSYSNTSLYAGADLHSNTKHPIRIGVCVGAITGYAGTPSHSLVMVLPNITIGNEHIRLRVGVIPIQSTPITATLGVKF